VNQFGIDTDALARMIATVVLGAVADRDDAADLRPAADRALVAA
jgi:hypothetical protein